MLVVDASCLAEVLVAGPRSEAIRERLASDDDHAAPHVIDAEVLGVIRRYRMMERLDDTGATQAIDDLVGWPGERYGHRLLLSRAWELRHNVRSWDGLYVALAEALGATLLTTDERLARARGPACEIATVS